MTGLLKFCPVKNALTTMLDEQNKTAYTKSEMNNPIIDGEDGSGGYRTGNPSTGSTERTYTTSIKLQSLRLITINFEIFEKKLLADDSVLKFILKKAL